jgi:hypothetical protein
MNPLIEECGDLETTVASWMVAVVGTRVRCTEREESRVDQRAPGSPGQDFLVNSLARPADKRPSLNTVQSMRSSEKGDTKYDTLQNVF